MKVNNNSIPITLIIFETAVIEDGVLSNSADNEKASEFDSIQDLRKGGIL